MMLDMMIIDSNKGHFDEDLGVDFYSYASSQPKDAVEMRQHFGKSMASKNVYDAFMFCVHKHALMTGHIGYRRFSLSRKSLLQEADAILEEEFSSVFEREPKIGYLALCRSVKKRDSFERAGAEHHSLVTFVTVKPSEEAGDGLVCLLTKDPDAKPELSVPVSVRRPEQDDLLGFIGSEYKEYKADFSCPGSVGFSWETVPDTYNFCDYLGIRNAKMKGHKYLHSIIHPDSLDKIHNSRITVLRPVLKDELKSTKGAYR